MARPLGETFWEARHPLLRKREVYSSRRQGALEGSGHTSMCMSPLAPGASSQDLISGPELGRLSLWASPRDYVDRRPGWAGSCGHSGSWPAQIT